MRLPLWLPLLVYSAGIRLGAQEPLTHAAQVRALSASEAKKLPRVQLEAVATYYLAEWGILFIHDGTEGICVPYTSTS